LVESRYKSARLDIFSKIGNITASFPLLPPGEEGKGETSSHEGRRKKRETSSHEGVVP